MAKIIVSVSQKKEIVRYKPLCSKNPGAPISMFNNESSYY